MTAYGPLEERGIRPFVYQELQQLLPGYYSLFAPAVREFAYDRPMAGVDFGLATFVRGNHRVIQHQSFPTYRHLSVTPTPGDGTTIPKNVQMVTLATPIGTLRIFNWHGLWWRSNKGDVPARGGEVRRLRWLLNSVPSPIILAGDYNMLREARCLKAIESAHGGLINLVTKHGITSTRSAWYPKPLRDADYVHISRDVVDHRFEVLPAGVSDHEPLFFEFSINTSTHT